MNFLLIFCFALAAAGKDNNAKGGGFLSDISGGFNSGLGEGLTGGFTSGFGKGLSGGFTEGLSFGGLFSGQVSYEKHLNE